MVKKLVFFDFTTFECLKQIISNFDDIVIIIYMPFNKTVKIGFQPSDDFSALNLESDHDILSIEIVNCHEFISFFFRVFDTCEKYEPSLCVVDTKIEDLGSFLLIFENSDFFIASK